MCPVKGQREFILAAHQIRNEFPQAKFHIIGEDIEFDGHHRHELEQLTEQLDLGGYVQFVGFRSDAARLMHAFDLFVLPSWIEGLPVAILAKEDIQRKGRLRLAKQFFRHKRIGRRRRGK